MDGRDKLGSDGKQAYLVFRPISQFSFSFPILLHQCEVTYKNNYLMYTNIFSKYNRLHIICIVEDLIIFKLIYYFQWFK